MNAPKTLHEVLRETAHKLESHKLTTDDARRHQEKIDKLKTDLECTEGFIRRRGIALANYNALIKQMNGIGNAEIFGEMPKGVRDGLIQLSVEANKRIDELKAKELAVKELAQSLKAQIELATAQKDKNEKIKTLIQNIKELL